MTLKKRNTYYIPTWKGDLSSNLFNVLVNIQKKPITRAVPVSGGNNIHGSHQLATNEPAVLIGRNSRVGNSQNNQITFNNGKNGLGGPGGIGRIARIFGPQPIKHWRLQLNTVSIDNSGNIIKSGSYNKTSIAHLMDRPGASIVNTRTPNTDPCATCDPSGNGGFGIQYYHRNNLTSFLYKNSKTCIKCTSADKIIKSGSTKLNKNYYTDSRAYLKSRCKTYDQKLSFTQLPSGINYPTKNTMQWPTENICGAQTFKMNSIPDISGCSPNIQLCNNNQTDATGAMNFATTTYKPNNYQYAQQGAVSSSSRIERLKYNTINKAASSLTSAFGAAAANAGKYRTNSEGGYFIKNKVFNCNQNNSIYYKKGNRNLHCTGIKTSQQLGLLPNKQGLTKCHRI